eukprot:4680346-Pyramimonas_sp.AAC.1
MPSCRVGPELFSRRRAGLLLAGSSPPLTSACAAMRSRVELAGRRGKEDAAPSSMGPLRCAAQPRGARRRPSLAPSSPDTGRH